MNLSLIETIKLFKKVLPRKAVARVSHYTDQRAIITTHTRVRQDDQTNMTHMSLKYWIALHEAVSLSNLIELQDSIWNIG